MKRFTAQLQRWHRMVLVFGAGMFLALSLIPSVAEATIPKLINFQGILKDGSGNLVLDGSYSVTFRIYEVPAGGTLLWAETTSVTTANGLFAVLLGASNPVPDTVFKGSDRWLGIAVSPDGEMAIRQQLVSVGYAYRVNSVDSASGGTITSKVSIGPGHTNTGLDAFVAGAGNTASGGGATVGGGGPSIFSSGNTASGDIATVGGGGGNAASNFSATVGGGINNTASGTSATVSGGGGNIASGYSATVGGGEVNTGSMGYATVSGDYGNRAGEFSATVGGGYGDTASGIYATVGGGGLNKARGQFSVVSGGGGATDADSNSALEDYSVVGGGFRNIAGDNSATVGGGALNNAGGAYSTVAGGTSNNASSQRSAVGGGEANTASNLYATVGGGQGGTATGRWATIGGGNANVAGDSASTVGGGRGDTASGAYATVPGGRGNYASGRYSLAAGRRAKAIHTGTFVWSDSTNADFASTAPNQFLIRADAVGIGTASPSAKLDVAGSLEIGNGTPITRVLSAAGALDFPSTGGESSSDLTVTVTGAALGDVVSIGVPNGSVVSNTFYTAWVSAANTVTIRFTNNTGGGSEDPPSGTFRVMVTQF